jgi:hypothetical protein
MKKMFFLNESHIHSGHADLGYLAHLTSQQVIDSNSSSKQKNCFQNFYVEAKTMKEEMN